MGSWFAAVIDFARVLREASAMRLAAYRNMSQCALRTVCNEFAPERVRCTFLEVVRGELNAQVGITVQEKR